jgi:hypothetical protein
VDLHLYSSPGLKVLEAGLSPEFRAGKSVAVTRVSLPSYLPPRHRVPTILLAVPSPPTFLVLMRSRLHNQLARAKLPLWFHPTNILCQTLCWVLDVIPSSSHNVQDSDTRLGHQRSFTILWNTGAKYQIEASTYPSIDPTTLILTIHIGLGCDSAHRSGAHDKCLITVRWITEFLSSTAIKKIMRAEPQTSGYWERAGADIV